MDQNILFLDIDGVLVTHRAFSAAGGEGIMKTFDPVACGLLKRLLKETRSKFVVSSTWRKERSRDSMACIFEAACPGLSKYMVEGNAWKTPVLNTIRGNEIVFWMQNNNLSANSRICILDDDSDMGKLKEFLVKTDCYDGFGFRDYLKAEAILNNKPIPSLIL